MKKLLISLLLILPLLFFGQNYQLINASTKKLFASWPGGRFAYSLSIDSAKAMGSDSVYYNFLGLDDEGFESDTCNTGEESFCVGQKSPVWTGPMIKYDNHNRYLFYNLQNDSLCFRFIPDTDSSVVFFKDSARVFSLQYEKTDTITIPGILDSARYFKIIHSDLNGNPVDSPLNGWDIVIGKNLGMISFFVVDSFPDILRPLKIAGNISPNAGFYELTNEMVYDYQPGDEIQFMDYSYYEPGQYPPWYNYTKYIKTTFLSRVEFEDTIKYTAKQTIFYKDSTFIDTDTITIDYARSEVIARIPFEKFNGRERKIFKKDYCGIPHWTYTTFADIEYLYCAADECWLGNTYMPPEYKYEQYVKGVGLYEKSQWLIDPQNGYDIGTKIIYYKLGGEICGEEVVAGINTPSVVRAAQIVLYPNPSSTSVQILSPVTVVQITLFDITGSKIFSRKTTGNKFTLDVKNYPQGIYFLKVKLANSQVVVKKLIVS